MSNKKIDIIKLNLIRIYFIIVFFEAFFRYIFQTLGLVQAIYIKDAIIMFVFLLSIFKIKISKRFFGLLFVCFISILMGIIYIDNSKQIVLGILKILMIFWNGFFNSELIFNDIKNNQKFYKICFGMLCFGILLNKFVSFPWEGMEAIVDGIGITTSRAWTTMGIKRVAGFSRTSFNAATYVVICGIISLYKSKKSKKLYLLFFMLLIIYLTTTKGVLISIIFLLGYILFKEKKAYAKYICIGMLSIMIFFPIFSLKSESVFRDLRNSMNQITYIKYLSSIEERCIKTWPNVIMFIKNNR